MILNLVAIALLGSAPRPAQLATWGAEPLHEIQSHLFRADRGLYTDRDGANLLDLSAEAELILALSAASAYDDKFLPDLRTAVASAASYRTTSGTTPGFAEMPDGAGGNRSYAHNAALAIALNEASRISKSAQAAEMAEQALTFALSGEDAAAGGIAEFEGAASGKTADAAAAAAEAILSQSDISTPKHADELYAWIRSHLRDPTTNLPSPVPTAAGTDRPAPEAGDTARMIEIACLLYRATADEKYGEQARRLEELSVGRWFHEDGGVRADTVGGSRLVEAWIDRIHICPRPTESYGASMKAYAALQRLHDAGRDRGGHYGRAFGLAPTSVDAWRVVDQAAAARAFFAAALSLRTAKK